MSDDPKTLEDVPVKERAKTEADAFAEADELEVQNVEPVDTAATVEEPDSE